jgi:hypothetical protein
MVFLTRWFYYLLSKRRFFDLLEHVEKCLACLVNYYVVFGSVPLVLLGGLYGGGAVIFGGLGCLHFARGGASARARLGADDRYKYLIYAE